MADVARPDSSGNLTVSFGGTPRPANAPFRAFKTTDASDSSGTLLLVEKHKSNNVLGSTNDCVALNAYDMEYESGRRVLWKNPHKDRFNFLFVDGHVQLLAKQDTCNMSRFQPHGPLPANRWDMWDSGAWTRKVGD
jgi:prepilin-type processing-associated H-X9-DG protein